MLRHSFQEENMEPASGNSVFYKQMYIKAGIVCGILVVFLSILILVSLLARKSWRTGLRNEIEKVFAENSVTEYSVGEYLKLNSNISFICSVYRAEKVSKGNNDSYAVIVRVATLYGPVAAVYVYEATRQEANFIGFAQLNDRVVESVKNATMNSQVLYWSKKIPAIVKTASKGENKNEKK